MADLKFIGVNFPAVPNYRQADPTVDRLLVNTLGPSGGASGPLVVSPVSAVAGSNLVLDVQNGAVSVFTVNGSGTASSTRPWTNGTDHSWSNAFSLSPSGSPSFGTGGSVQLVIGSGISPTSGSGTDGSNNPAAGSLLLQTDGTAWLKTGAGATSWIQLGVGGGGGDPFSIISTVPPNTPAAVNVDVPPGSFTLPDITAPAGEPVSADDPYYLIITDGVNTENLLVIGQSGNSRFLAKATGFGYLASAPSTVAFAGYVTYPQSDGLMPSSAYIRLLAVEPYADRTSAANVVAALGSNAADVAFNNVQLKDVADPTDPQDAATKAYVDSGGGGDPFVLLSPTAPGATASVNADIPSNSWSLPDITAPAGEPATGDDPYYLVLDDGVNTETVQVIGKTGVSRALAKSTGYSFLASTPTTVAFAGYMTDPQDDGLMPAIDWIRLRSVEPYADRTSPAKVVGALSQNASDIDFNGVALTNVSDPSNPQDVTTLAYLEGYGPFIPLDPTVPGATASTVGNNPSGSNPLLYVASPAGEPAEPTAEPYYLVITNGVNTETLTVLRRSGSTRVLLSPTSFTFNAGPTTVAYAGPARTSGTAPAAPLLLSLDGLDRARLNGIEEFADVTDSTNVVAALAANGSPVGFNNQVLQDVADPTNPQEVATKAYVDGSAPTFTDFSFGLDDFDSQPGMSWASQTGGDGSNQHLPALAMYGYPGEGWVSLAVGDPADDANLASRTWQQLDSSVAMEMSCRVVITDGSFAEAHDECTAFIGWLSPGGGQMGLSIVDPGTASLILYNGSLFTDAVTLPSLSAGQAWRFRLVATPSSLGLYGAVDDGAEALLASITEAPYDQSWTRYFTMTGETAATFRIMNLDYVGWSGARIADGSSSGGPPNSIAVWPMETVVEKALAQPQDQFLLGIDPDSSQDDSQGYSIGSHWVNINSKQAFICTDATTNAAIWKPVNSGPVKTVASGTYTVVPEDDGLVLRFTAPCVVTVPDSTSGVPLRNGHETTMFCTTGVLEFADASAGVSADPLHAASLSRFSSETMAIVAIKMLAGVDEYVLAGDLLPSTPDPLTDGDFLSNGRLIRTGAGVYNTIFDYLGGFGTPDASNDDTLGYSVGSLYVGDDGAVYVCSDASTGAAVWSRINRLSDREYHLRIASSRKYVEYFRDDFTQNTLGTFATIAAGAGAGNSILSAAGNLSKGKINVTAGTTGTGASALLCGGGNMLYQNQLQSLHVEAIVEILNAATVGEDYTAHYAGVGMGLTGNGFSLSYVRSISDNWQLTSWAGTTPTYTDTGVPITFGGGVYSVSSMFIEADWVVGSNVVYRVNGNVVGSVAPGGTVSATYVVAARILGVAGTSTTRQTLIDWAFSWGELLLERGY